MIFVETSVENDRTCLFWIIFSAMVILLSSYLCCTMMKSNWSVSFVLSCRVFVVAPRNQERKNFMIRESSFLWWRMTKTVMIYWNF